MTNSEWDDIPNSSELFGGDFFADELMELADHVGQFGSSTPLITATAAAAAVVPHLSLGGEEDAVEDDADKSAHPGVLVALKAAAMDGGLSPLGSSPTYVAMPTASGGEDALPPYPTMTGSSPPPIQPKNAAGAKSKTGRVTRASVAAAAAAAKRPAPASSSKGPAKKHKGGASPSKGGSTTAKGSSTTAKDAVAAVVPAVPQSKKATPFKGSDGVVTAVVPQKAVENKANVAAAVAAPAPPMRVVSSSSVSQVNGVKTPAATAKVAVATPAVPGAHSRPPQPNAAAPKKTTAVTAPPATAPPPVATPAASTVPHGFKSAIIPPKPKIPVGAGVTHQVMAPRPTAVPSSAAAAARRIVPPAPHTAQGARILGKPVVPIPQPTTSSTGVIRAKSEADFKDVASAAVTSLIQNASSAIAKPGPKPVTKPGEKPVDTSTAHINALTSQNWVTACNPVPAPETTPASSVAACDKAARNARRATLTQEERAKQNRDRNREHARNTRLRKKAYVEELKRTLTELVSQRDAAVIEKRHEAQRNREQREVRFRVMEEFLKLRGRNESTSTRWVAILEDGFTLTLPRTTFRRMVDDDKSPSDVTDDDNSSKSSSVEQVLQGSTAVMEDSQHLSTYLQSIGGPTASFNEVQIAYQCDRKKFFMDGNVAFLDFDLSTSGVVAKGMPNEVVSKGSMRASFSPASNKLISVNITFDTGAFVQQIEDMGDAASTEATAAAVAAHEADALLDSLQMPQIFVDKKDVAAAAAVAGTVSVSSDDSST